MKPFFSSSQYKRLIFWIGLIVLILLAFQGGVFVGFHKASMGYDSDDRYQRHFRNGPFGFPADDFPEAHGAIGRVLSVSLPTIIIEDKSAERTIRVATDTVVRKDRDKVEVTTIAANDFIVVIGSPNDKQEVTAKFIRMLPPPPGFIASSSMTVSTSTN